MIPLREEEIESVLDFFDVDGVLVCAVLENQLLEVQECSLMRNFLSDLDDRSPRIGGI